MASVAYSSTNGQISFLQSTEKEFLCVLSHVRVFSLFGNNIDYSFRRGSSREGHELSNITLTPNQSLNATANQLDIFQFAANPN